MEAIGIIAEYNPFHLGHGWHIAESRKTLENTEEIKGEDIPVICVMSGSWVQRGECALTDKWTRTGLALQGGADLVLELPMPWSIASAEGFARGGVDILRATGVVKWVSFGSESGDLESIKAVSDVINGAEYRELLKEELKSGCSFATARQRVVEQLTKGFGKVLEGPNDNLAVEYVRAIGDDLTPIAIKRRGASHDSGKAEGGFASASLIRELAGKGDWSAVERWTPEGTAEVIKSAGIADMRYVERAMLSKLRSMDRARFAALPDSGEAEGLPARLEKAARESGTLEEFYTLAKTKRYAHARIRRLALWAFLDIGSEISVKPQYLRVLGANGRGQAVLREMKKASQLPVLTKTAHIKELDKKAREQFEMECKATDLYGLCFETARPCGLDLLKGPVIV